MFSLNPRRLRRLSLENRSSAYIGKAIITTLASPPAVGDRQQAEDRFEVWRALAERLSPDHWALLSQALGWPAPATGTFAAVIPESLRDFRVGSMPNRLIAAHVLVGHAIRAAWETPVTSLQSEDTPHSLNSICWDWIDGLCTDDEIADIRITTGFISESEYAELMGDDDAFSDR
jgi:hypothetical protein